MKKICVLICMVCLSAGILCADNAAEFDLVFKRMAQKLSMAENKLPNKTVAVYGFDVIGRPQDVYAVYATEKLTHELVNAGTLLVIERSRITEILKEQSFSISDVVDSGTAARIGKILAVDAVIIGTILVTETRTEFIVRIVQSDRGIILASVDDAVVYTVTAASESGGTSGTASKKLGIGKKTFSPAERIIVTYEGLPGNKTDWITLVPASAPEDSYGQWFYTDGAVTDTHTFDRVPAGEYEIRLYYEWPAGGYEVVDRIAVTVK